MQAGSYFGCDGTFEGFAIREVAVESVGREVESGGDGADGDAVEAVLREEMHGGLKDRRMICLCGVSHRVHCTPSVST